MSNVLNSQIGLDVKVNQPQTGGLDVTLAQLREIKAELKGLGQAWRAGMQPPAAAMMGKEDWAKSFKQQFGKRSTFSMGDIEKVVTERMRMQGQNIDAAMQTSIRDGLLRAVATRPKGHQWQHAISGKIGRDSAASLIARWGEMEQAFTKAAFDSLTTGLRAGRGAAPVGGKMTAASGAVSATLGNGSIPLVIDPSRIQVSLGAGNVTFTVGANQVQGVAAATGAATTAATAAGATPAPGAAGIPAPGPRAQVPGTLVKTVTNDTGTNRAGSVKVTEYRLDSTGRLIETTTGGRSTKTKSTEQLYEPFNDPAQFRKYFQGRMSTAANPATRLAELDRALGMITQKQASGQWRGGPWAEIADNFGGRRPKYEADRDKAAQREQAQADRVSAEASRVTAARQSSRIRDLHQLQGGQLSAAEALALRQMAGEQGYAADSERFGTQGRGRNRVYRQSTTYRKKEADGTARAFTVGLEYNPAEVARAGGDTSGLTPIGGTTSGSKRSAKPTDAGDGRYSGKYKDLITNTQNVTAWASSVWVLYGALNAAKQSLTTLIETGYETARLEQVFSGVGGTTLDLRDNVLALAAANGRSSEEAMSATVAWSRLGLTFDQVGEAVRVSMMAANVAELSTADATKYLQAVMAAYRLEVSQLSTVLGEMNEISNNWNVTNADIMTGLARTASVAKQAGMPLAELMGVIGAAVGFTGQSGANMGNSFKSLTVALSNPEIQKFLNQDFGIKVREGDTGEFRGLSTVLQELFVRYQELTNAERQYLLVRVAGKTQASR
ncbi:MAG: phage tail tape measure protein, partial [Limisphaerales bacterium]